MSLLNIDNNLNNYDDDFLKYICIKFHQCQCCVYENYKYEINFLKNNDINYQEVFKNPNCYILGRDAHISTNPERILIIDIKLFKVEPNFYKNHPKGCYVSNNMSNMYLPPRSSMMDILKYLNYM